MRCFCVSLAFVSLSLVIAAPAFAGLNDESSWTLASPDGKYLLVMLTPETLRKERQKEFEIYQFDGIFDEAGIELKKKYSESGIYLNDGSTAPLWLVPFHIELYSVYFSENGDHLLLAKEETKHTDSNIPVGGYLYFYHKSGSHQAWPEHAIGWGWGLKHLIFYQLLGIRGDGWTSWISTDFDSIKSTYSIDTDKGESFTFDVTTGRLMSSSSLWNKLLAVYFLAMPLTIYFIVCKNRERSTTKTSLKRYSLKNLLVAMTVISVWFWLGTVHWPLAIAVIATPLIGGGIARIWSGRSRAWITGTLLAIYGCIWGVYLWAILVEPSMWEAKREYPYVWFLPAFAAIGLVFGGILGGLLERRTHAAKVPLHPLVPSC